MTEAFHITGITRGKDFVVLQVVDPDGNEKTITRHDLHPNTVLGLRVGDPVLSYGWTTDRDDVFPDAAKIAEAEVKRYIP